MLRLSLPCLPELGLAAVAVHVGAQAEAHCTSLLKPVSGLPGCGSSVRAVFRCSSRVALLWIT